MKQNWNIVIHCPPPPFSIFKGFPEYQLSKTNIFTTSNVLNLTVSVCSSQAIRKISNKNTRAIIRKAFPEIQVQMPNPPPTPKLKSHRNYTDHEHLKIATGFL